MFRCLSGPNRRTRIKVSLENGQLSADISGVERVFTIFSSRAYGPFKLVHFFDMKRYAWPCALFDAVDDECIRK